MKRALVVLLSLALILTHFGILCVVAEEPATDADAIAAGYYYRVGDVEGGTYCKDLSGVANAVNALQSATPTNVYMIQSQESTKEWSDGAATFNYPVTIQGLTNEREKYVIRNSWYMCQIKAEGTTTFKNLTIVGKYGYRVDAGTVKELVFDNVDVSVSEGLFVHIKQVYSATHNNDYNTLTFRDSVVRTTGGNALLVSQEGGYEKWTVNLVNSTVTSNRAIADSGNSAVFKFLGSLNFNMVNSTVSNQRTSSSTMTSGLIEMWNTKSLVFKADADSVLEIGATGSNLSNMTYKFLHANTISPCVWEDGGLTYRVSADAAKGTIVFPTVSASVKEEGSAPTATDDKTVFKYAGGTVSNGGNYTNSSATEALSFKVEQFEMTYEDKLNAGAIFRVGSANVAENLYATFADAYTAANAGDTIYVLTNASLGSTIFNKAITVDGGGFTLTESGSYPYVVMTSVTFKNATIQFASQGFSFNPTAGGQVFTLENIKASNGSGLFAAVGHSKGTIEGISAKLVVKDCELNSRGTVLGIQKKIQWNVEILNSTLTNQTANKDDIPVVMFGWDINPFVALHIDGTSKLIANSTDASIDGRNGVLWVENGMPNTILIDKGAEICVGEVARSFSFIYSNKATVTDLGAKYVASVSAQTNGVKIPNYTLPSNLKLLGYSINGAGLTGSGNSYKVENADAEVTFTPLLIQSSDFVMMNGASTRTQLPLGLRFTAILSEALYDNLMSLDCQLEYGMIVAKTRKVVGNFNLEGMSVADFDIIQCDSDMQQSADGTYLVRQGIYGFEATKESLTTSYSAVAYITLRFADGVTQTIYTVYDKTNNSRSMYDVASGAVNKGVADPVLNWIVSYCSE